MAANLNWSLPARTLRNNAPTGPHTGRTAKMTTLTGHLRTRTRADNSHSPSNGVVCSPDTASCSSASRTGSRAVRTRLAAVPHWAARSSTPWLQKWLCYRVGAFLCSSPIHDVTARPFQLRKKDDPRLHGPEHARSAVSRWLMQTRNWIRSWKMGDARQRPGTSFRVAIWERSPAKFLRLLRCHADITPLCLQLEPTVHQKSPALLWVCQDWTPF
jgi:hypothetical protein